MKNYKYFKAPIKAATGYQASKACSVCEKITEVIEVGNQQLCEICLRTSDVTFHHHTSIGYVEKEGLIDFIELEPIDLPKHFQQASLDELLKTPQIPTLQEDCWPTCCNDFMAYLGIWQPNDFRKNSDNPYHLYQQMTGDYLEYLWRVSEKALGKSFEEWGSDYVQYYAFECLHCQEKSGYWDC